MLPSSQPVEAGAGTHQQEEASAATHQTGETNTADNYQHGEEHCLEAY
jgi:hypothetical protein